MANILPGDQPEKKRRLFGDFFKRPEAEVDPETGVKKEQGQSKAGKAMSYLLPILFSMTGGAGALPGLMAARSGQRGRERGAEEGFEEAKGEARGEQLQQDKFAEQQRHSRAMEGAAYRPSEKERAVEKMTSLFGKYLQPDQAGPESPAGEKAKYEAGITGQMFGLGKKKLKIPRAEESFFDINPEDRTDLESMTSDQLIEAMKDPDPTTRAAAQYMFNLKKKQDVNYFE